jgi:hypothetical protein
LTQSPSCRIARPGRYTGLDPEFTVSRGIALGFVSDDAIDDALRAKLAHLVESLRNMRDE